MLDDYYWYNLYNFDISEIDKNQFDIPYEEEQSNIQLVCTQKVSLYFFVVLE